MERESMKKVKAAAVVVGDGHLYAVLPDGNIEVEPIDTTNVTLDDLYKKYGNNGISAPKKQQDRSL